MKVKSGLCATADALSTISSSAVICLRSLLSDRQAIAQPVQEYPARALLIVAREDARFANGSVGQVTGMAWKTQQNSLPAMVASEGRG